MNLLSTTLSRSMDAVPWTWDAGFSDADALLPLIAVCLTSMLCTALWLLAVSGYVCRGKVRVVR